MAKTSTRLVSIDLLRGLTVMLMIFVNNGAGDSIFPILVHPKWNGLSLADLVFPSFLFIMGMSTYLSLRKFNFQWSKVVAKKIVKRGALLFLIGLGINWLGPALAGHPFDFEHLRIWGVMQRLGICYFVCAALALTWKRGFIPIIIAGLIAYSAILLLGHGFEDNVSTNILARADINLLGVDHLYTKSSVDPEGFVSNFCAIFHTMIGFVVMETITALQGRASCPPGMGWILRFKNLSPTKFLAIFGVAFIIIGLILTIWFPLNKRVWSTSYVFVTIGIATTILSLLIYLIDSKGGGKEYNQYVLLKSFGMNPLILYVGSEVLAIIFGAYGINDACYNAIHFVITNASWAGFAYALLFTAIFAVIGICMYKKRIFIKL